MRRGQLSSNLAAGRAIADHQHIAGRRKSGIAVRLRRELDDVRGESSPQRRNGRLLERAGRKDDRAGGQDRFGIGRRTEQIADPVEPGERPDGDRDERSYADDRTLDILARAGLASAPLPDAPSAWTYPTGVPNRQGM